jgi:acylphosphatase
LGAAGNRRRARARVYGRVQGVFFRESTRRRALELGLAGFALNRSDGSVEVLCEGAPDAVAELLTYLRVGPPHARVDRLESADEVPAGDLRGFQRLP